MVWVQKDRNDCPEAAIAVLAFRKYLVYLVIISFRVITLLPLWI